MTMPKLEWEGRITLGTIFAAMNFFGVMFAAGMVWNSMTGAVAQNSKRIEELRAEQTGQLATLRSEVYALRQQDTSIAVLKTDVSYIKESIQRIEAAVQSVTKLR